MPQIEKFLNGLSGFKGVTIDTTIDKQPVAFEDLMNNDKLISDIMIKIFEPEGEMIFDIILSAEETPEEALTKKNQLIRNPNTFRS